MPSAADVIRLLKLEPHPEGGHFVQTFRDTATVNGRPVSTAIYYLLARGERGHWHKVDAVEVWHYYAGAPLVLETAASLGDWTLVGCTVAPGFQYEGFELAPKDWAPG